MNQVTEPGLPLLVVVEGENDIHFLMGISKMLHRADPELPDLSRLANDRRIMFLPTGGSNLNVWAHRVASLHKREFFMFDREQEPETTERRQVVEFINTRPGCSATLTTKRTVENYLHPLAIRESCGIDLVFDDDTDVAGLLAVNFPVEGTHFSGTKGAIGENGRFSPLAPLSLQAMDRKIVHFVVELVG